MKKAEQRSARPSQRRASVLRSRFHRGMLLSGRLLFVGKGDRPTPALRLAPGKARVGRAARSSDNASRRQAWTFGFSGLSRRRTKPGPSSWREASRRPCWRCCCFTPTGSCRWIGSSTTSGATTCRRAPRRWCRSSSLSCASSYRTGCCARARPGYLVELDGHSLDLRRFEELHAGGREALARGRAGEAAAALSGALELWRGPALAEFEEPFARLEEAPACRAAPHLPGGAHRGGAGARAPRRARRASSTRSYAAIRCASACAGS